MQSTK